MQMHARAVHAHDRLGHERGMQAVLERNGPDDKAEGGNVVRRLQRIRVFKIDLMLAGRRLVLFRPNGRVRQLLRQAGLTHLETSDILEPGQVA